METDFSCQKTKFNNPQYTKRTVTVISSFNFLRMNLFYVMQQMSVIFTKKNKIKNNKTSPPPQKKPRSSVPFTIPLLFLTGLRRKWCCSRARRNRCPDWSNYVGPQTWPISSQFQHSSHHQGSLSTRK